MTERWRRPAVVLDVKPSPAQGLWLPDGRTLGEAEISFDAESIERMRLGYLCCKCLEPLEHAWPEHCPVCGCPIRTEQAEFFAREFGGEEQLGSRVSLADEIEALPERVAKEIEDGRKEQR